MSTNILSKVVLAFPSTVEFIQKYSEGRHWHFGFRFYPVGQGTRSWTPYDRSSLVSNGYTLTTQIIDLVRFFTCVDVPPKTVTYCSLAVVAVSAGLLFWGWPCWAQLQMDVSSTEGCLLYSQPHRWHADFLWLVQSTHCKGETKSKALEAKEIQWFIFLHKIF